MKKTILTAAIISMTAIGLVGCGGKADNKTSDAKAKVVSQTETTTVTETTTSVPIPKTTGEAISKLQSMNQHLVKYIEYNENTDENKLLGRPHSYYSKTNFFDDRGDKNFSFEDRIENKLPDDGTIEFFNTKEDCDKRCKYISTIFQESPLGNIYQYLFKYDKALFRITYRLTPAEAEEYKHQMDSILNETSKNVEW